MLEPYSLGHTASGSISSIIGLIIGRILTQFRIAGNPKTLCFFAMSYLWLISEDKCQTKTTFAIYVEQQMKVCKQNVFGRFACSAIESLPIFCCLVQVPLLGLPNSCELEAKMYS